MAKQLAFVFPGQGSQAVGMGKNFFDASPLARQVFNEANEALGFDLASLCFNGPMEKLTQTEMTQPAILTVSLAALALLTEAGVVPSCAAGHSLGEYAAYQAAGTFSRADVIRLVHFRGKFMREACDAQTGGMAAVIGLSEEKLAEIVEQLASRGVLNIANLNAPGQGVLSGAKGLVQEACALVKQAGGRGILLPVGGPFHSDWMKPAAQKLEEALASVSFSAPRFPVFTNVTAKPETEIAAIRHSLMMQVYQPVRWVEVIQNMIAQGISLFVEVGPGKVLSGLIRKIDRTTTVLNVEDMASFETTQQALHTQGVLA